MSDSTLQNKLEQLIQQLKRMIDHLERLESARSQGSKPKEVARRKDRFQLSRSFSAGDIVQAFVMILVFASFIYSVRSYNLSDDTRKKQLRAWVGEVQSKSFVSVSEEDTHVHWTLFFSNYGTTPAKNFRVHSAATLLVWNEENFSRVRKTFAGLDVSKLSNPSTVLFNGQDIENTDKMDLFLTQKQVDQVRKHELILLVGGKVGYDDIFGQAHTYVFCGIYNAPDQLGKEGLTVCPGADDAD